MSKKITWDKVRDAFKKSHPKLDKTCAALATVQLRNNRANV